MNDIQVTLENHVGIVKICRPPNNYFDADLIRGLAESFEALDADSMCRTVLLAAEGKNFCAGANFGGTTKVTDDLYRHAVRLFRTDKPVIAAVQGAAVGGGLGVALVGDFRVASPETRFTANFSRLGFHPGFGISVTLPRVVGIQNAAMLLLTGRRIGGEEAKSIGLVDVLVPDAELFQAALSLATEIAQSAPIAVVSTRRTLRQGLADAVAAATRHEWAEQQRHFQTEDFKEGVKAMGERRLPDFAGR